MGTILSGATPANGPWTRVTRAQTSGLIQEGTDGAARHGACQAFTATLPPRQPDQPGAWE